MCVLRAKKSLGQVLRRISLLFCSLRRSDFASDLIRSTRSSVSMKALGQVSHEIEAVWSNDPAAIP